MEWVPSTISRLRALREMNKSYDQCAAIFNCSRGVIAGGIARYINGYHDPRRGRLRIRLSAIDGNQLTGSSNFTESYEVFKARKKKEREAARAASPQVPLAGQVSD